MFIADYTKTANKLLIQIENHGAGSRALKAVAIFQIAFSETIHRICVAASLFASISFQNFDAFDFPIGLVFGFYFLFLTAGERLIAWFGIYYVLCQILIQIFISILFLVFAERSVMFFALNYFSLFVIFSFYSKFFFKGLIHQEHAIEKIYLAVMLLGAVVSFGYNFYGKIKPEYGGGFPRTAHVVLQKRLPDDIVDQDTNNSFTALLINSTDKFLQFELKNNTLAISSDQVIAMTIKAHVTRPIAGANFREKLPEWGRLKYITEIFNELSRKHD